MSKLAVIDSGVAILRTVKTPSRPSAEALWDRFLQDAVALYAPRLWANEVTSVFHKYFVDKMLTAEEAEDLVRIVFGFGVNLVDEDESLCLAAFRWATRLNQRAAYDAFYLALADRLDAEFWTADRRLFNTAVQAGVSRVRLMTEILK